MRKRKGSEDVTGQNNAKEDIKKVKRKDATSTGNVSANIQPNGPNPDVYKIPCNETGTFIEKITVSCLFCHLRFDRPDEYYLHHGEKHAKLYGPLPENSNTVKDTAENGHFENNRPNSINKKRRCSMYLNKENDISDISESSDNETSTGAKIDNSNPSPENSNTKVPKRNKTRESSEIHKDNNSTSSDSDDDDQHIFNAFVENITQSLLKFQGVMQNRLKKKRRLVYQCKICEINFLKESEWLQHLATEKHTVIWTKCDHCTLKFSTNEMQKHLKMHEKNDKNDKKLKFHIVTDTSYNLSDNNSDISSESDSEINKPEPIPIPECTTTEVVEPAIKKVHDNGITDNIQVISNEQANMKKIHKATLFKCDDCEVHFLNKRAVESHTRKGTHHLRMGNNSICETCTLKFSCPNILQQHTRSCHNNHRNLSKEDFEIITWTKWKSVNPRLMKSRSKPCHSIPTQNLKRIHNQNNNFQSKEMTMYACEGCTLHFTKYKTWNSHLNRFRCKSKFNKGAVKECPYCKVCFNSTNWIDHMKIHKENSSITKNNFKIIRKKPRIFKAGAMPQSDVVSTTGQNLDSNTVINEHNDDPSSNRSLDKDITNASEKCKVKLAKSIAAGKNGWRVVTNTSEDTGDTSNAVQTKVNSGIVADDSRNMNKDSESIQTLSGMESNQVTSNNDTAANLLLINSVSSTDDSTNNATNVSANTEKIGDHNIATFQDNIMVDISSTSDNIENAYSKSIGHFVIKTIGNNINEAQIKTNDQNPKPIIEKESITETKIKNTECYEEEIKSEYFAVDEQAIKHKKLVMTEDEQLIKIENNTETENISPEDEKDIRNSEGIKTGTDKTAPKDDIKIVNSFSMALRFEEPSSSSYVKNTIDSIGFPETMHIIATHKQNKTTSFSCELENPQSTPEGIDETFSSNEGDKMQQREERDYLNDEDTLQLDDFHNHQVAIELVGPINSTKEEALHNSNYNNDVTNNNNNSVINDSGRHSYESETHSNELSDKQADTNRESNVSVHKNNNYIATEILLNDKNTLHFSVPRKERCSTDQKETGNTSTREIHSFDYGGFCFRDRSKANERNEEFSIGLDTFSIKEEVEEAGKQSKGRKKEINKKQEMLEEGIILSDDDDTVMVPNTVETIVLSDDDE